MLPIRGGGGTGDDGVALDGGLVAGGAPAEDGVVAAASGDHGATSAASSGRLSWLGSGRGLGGRSRAGGVGRGAASAASTLSGEGGDDGGLGGEREARGDHAVQARDSRGEGDGHVVGRIGGAVLV